jgi:chromosome segregation ATPase
MMRALTTLGAFGLAMLVVALAEPSWAQQSKDSRERQALHRAQQMISQLEQDKQSLQQAKSEAEAKLAALSKDVDRLKLDASRAKSHIGEYEHAVGEWEKQNIELKSRLAEAERTIEESKRNAETAQRGFAQTTLENQRNWESEKKALEGAVGEGRQSIRQQEERAAACEDKNRKLAGIALDALRRYKNKGVWEALRQSEPVLGLHSVEVENLLEEYRDKVDAETIRPASR